MEGITMSAYIVSDETINCIVNGMIDYGIITTSSAQEKAEELLALNVASVNSLYRESRKPRRIVFKPGKYTPAEIMGCINCYQYQSCEIAGFRDIPSYYYTDWLKGRIIDKLLPDQPWGL